MLSEPHCAAAATTGRPVLYRMMTGPTPSPLGPPPFPAGPTVNPGVGGLVPDSSILPLLPQIFCKFLDKFWNDSSQDSRGLLPALLVVAAAVFVVTESSSLLLTEWRDFLSDIPADFRTVIPPAGADDDEMEDSDDVDELIASSSAWNPEVEDWH